ncbi:hypothetical protein AYI68_g2976 [Smittium mucronatum]|uniref:Uncharacterized protein n=1 Tax=Smittium mucronatum TaxID=133383 RepID=A0A1R0H194_9FUNG|nr:hypothetical protein AYI68_g2976 [Smittium mucronatum]
MEQVAASQNPVSQDQFKLLTEMVQIIPVTDLTAYPELTTALPAIEEDFFRLPLTEEEHKIAVYSYLKTSSMNYNPLTLNDTASSAVKKADIALYTSMHPEIMFASTMRALLADVAATAAQSRLQNLDNCLEHLENPTQLLESESKSLTGQESLYTLIFKKSAQRRQISQHFFRRQQCTISKESCSSNTVTAPNTTVATTADAIKN